MVKPPAERPGCGAPGCHADADTDAELCKEHKRRIRSRLAEIPGLLPDLQIAITRQDAFEQSAGRSASTGLPWNERAAIADQRLRATLTQVALGMIEDADERDPLHVAMAGGAAEVSRWAIRNRHVLVKLPAAGEYFEALDRAVHDARSNTDRPKVRTRFYVGPCPEIQGEGDAYPGQPCPGECWAIIPYDEDDLSKVSCLTCHHRWDPTQWRRLGKRIRKRLDQLRHGV